MGIPRKKTIKPVSPGLPFLRSAEFYGGALALLVFLGSQIFAYPGSRAAGSGGLAVLAAFSPAIILLLSMPWKAHYRIIRFFGILAGCMALWHYHSTFAHYLAWIYLIQRSGIFAALAAVFGVTLLPGHTPLISRIAGLVHGPLSGRVALYTRRVTLAWVFFFVTMTGLPLGIFLLAPENLLFLLTNLLTVTLLVFMFLAEYTVRCRAIPAGERSGMIEGLRAYFHYSGGTAADRQQPDNGSPGLLR